MQHYRTGETIIAAIESVIQDAGTKGAYGPGEQEAVDRLVEIAELHFTAARTFAALDKS
jgi:hypothetical protein